MAKFYVSSGPVRLVFDAPSAMDAAVRAFQWSCDKQAEIEAECALEHIMIAEVNGWQLQDEVYVSERGFEQIDARAFETFDVLLAWQHCPVPIA